jgi:peptidoglycan/LPS O-acetylase OafA/YrhL
VAGLVPHRPVSGAVCVLLAARSSSLWTGRAIAQWLGTRSYSLYLWHWPIVVTLAYLEWQADARAVAAGLALTLVLAHLSYHLVENPARLQLYWQLPGLVFVGMTV